MQSSEMSYSLPLSDYSTIRQSDLKIKLIAVKIIF